MILREILEALERIEKQMGTAPRQGSASGFAADAADEWMQRGIDSILSYQVGKKEESGE